MLSGETPCWPPRERRVALTLLRRDRESPLSPFYAWAPWIGVADTRGLIHATIACRTHDEDAVTRRVIGCAPRVLIAGFVPPAACRALVAAGIDVRLGPCSRPAPALVRGYRHLPKADGPADRRAAEPAIF